MSKENGVAATIAVCAISLHQYQTIEAIHVQTDQQSVRLVCERSSTKGPMQPCCRDAASPQRLTLTLCQSFQHRVL